MDALKKLFPLSFKYVGSVANLVIGILIYLVAGLIGGAVIALTAKLPIIGIVAGLAGGLLDLYVVAGIVIQVLVYCKVIKE